VADRVSSGLEQFLDALPKHGTFWIKPTVKILELFLLTISRSAP